MSHRGAAGKHTLPPNPTWLEFENTDGDESLWPTNNTEVVDAEGHVNYMRIARLDESLSIKWRTEVGKGVAKLSNLNPNNSYVLKTWPKGYQMFDHNKGPKDSPRHDAYLIGSTHTSKFRSVPEFIPHAYWLLLPDNESRPPCQCKYCTKSSGQRAITMTLGLLPKRSTPSGSIAPSTPSRRVAPPPRIPKPREGPHTYAAIRRLPKPPRPSVAPKQVFSRDRNADLRAAYGKTDVRLKRWFREGELLWCALSTPIARGKGEDDRIVFWPGIVEEVKYKPEPTPRHPGAGENNDKDDELPAKDWRITEHPSATDRGPIIERVSPTPWTVRQSYIYKMKLLVVSHSYTLRDDQVLPYQAYVPPDELLHAVQDVPYDQLDTRSERMGAFNPCPVPPPQTELDKRKQFEMSYKSGRRFIEAAAPYSVAVQVAAGIAGGWVMTDEWDYKLNIETANPTPAVAPPQAAGSYYPGSLHEVLAASMANNVAQNAMAESASMAGPLSAQTPAPPLVSQTIIQKRYQGIWWGTERIWTDDLVRLKIARRQVAPQGAENIFKPAGPSKRTVEYNRANGFPDPDGPEFDASGRGVFMRIEALYLADIQREDGPRGEIRVSGMLYELADADWEDPDQPNHEPTLAVGENKKDHPETSGPLLPDDSMMITDTAGPSAESTPAIPVSSTASRPAASQLDNKPFHNSQLSHPPRSERYPLPPAPIGFKFRPILPPGHESVVSLTLVSGRYYPCLLAHPLLQSTIDRALTSAVPQAGGPSANEHLWAMEGLSPGYYNSVDPSIYKKDRQQMVRDADAEARVTLEQFWQEKAREREEANRMVTEQEAKLEEIEPVQPMDVDK